MQTVVYTKKKIQLKKKKSRRERSASVVEGATYATKLQLVQDNEDETIPSRISLDGSDDFVMFDIETTGLG